MFSSKSKNIQKKEWKVFSNDEMACLTGGGGANDNNLPDPPPNP